MPAHDRVITFRTSDKTHEWLSDRAKDNGRSLNSELEQILKGIRDMTTDIDIKIIQELKKQTENATPEDKKALFDSVLLKLKQGSR